MAKLRTEVPITQEELKERLNYDPETGFFTWKRDSLRGIGFPIRSGQRAERIINKGHLGIFIDGNRYPAQRLAWLWIYGVWPRIVKFKDNNPNNCSIINLRESYDKTTREGRAARRIHHESRNPERVRDRTLYYRFGIRSGTYDKMNKEQHGVCKICGQPETSRRSGKLKRLSIDHCHKTGRVRALLCQGCNSTIGHAKENATVLERAAKYLRHHQGEQ